MRTSSVKDKIIVSIKNSITAIKYFNGIFNKIIYSSRSVIFWKHCASISI